MTFVGKPGAFKATTAYAVAYKANWNISFLSATKLIRGHRNQSWVELEKLLAAVTVPHRI